MTGDQKNKRDIDLINLVHNNLLHLSHLHIQAQFQDQDRKIVAKEIKKETKSEKVNQGIDQDKVIDLQVIAKVPENIMMIKKDIEIKKKKKKKEEKEKEKEKEKKIEIVIDIKIIKNLMQEKKNFNMLIINNRNNKRIKDSLSIEHL